MAYYPKGFLYGPASIIHETDVGKRSYKAPKYRQNINILPAEAPSNYLPVFPESDNNVDNLYVDSEIRPPIDVMEQTLTAYFNQERLQIDLEKSMRDADSIVLDIKPAQMFNSLVSDEYKRRAAISMNMYENAGMTPSQIQEKFVEDTLRSVRENPSAVRQNDPAIINALRMYLTTRGLTVPMSIDTMAPTNYERGTSQLMAAPQPTADLGEDMRAMGASRVPLDLPGTTVSLPAYSRSGVATSSASAGEFPGLMAAEAGLDGRSVGAMGGKFGAPSGGMGGARATTLDEEMAEAEETAMTGGASAAPSGRGRKFGSVSAEPSVTQLRLAVYAFTNSDTSKMTKPELNDYVRQIQGLIGESINDFISELPKKSYITVADQIQTREIFRRYRYQQLELTSA
jgi:hypothetical protein